MDLISLISKVKNKIAKSFKDRLKVPTEHSLDIPRRNMPQIKKKHLEKYMKWLKKQGVEIKETKLDIKKLKPTQKDFNLNKVVETMNTRQDKLKKPILVSKDNYIIDGHHKWLAHLNLDSEKIPALKANMNAKDLLAKSREFSKVHYKDVEENVYKEIDPKQKYADILYKVSKKLQRRRPLTPEQRIRERRQERKNEIRQKKLDERNEKLNKKHINRTDIGKRRRLRKEKIEKYLEKSKSNPKILEEWKNKIFDHYSGDKEKIEEFKSYLQRAKDKRDYEYIIVDEMAFIDGDKKGSIKSISTDFINKIKRKLAIDQSESKKIYEKIKDLPKGEKRDEALQKEVNDRGLDKEEINELMYDLTHTLKMINIQKPKVEKKKINHEEIGQELYENLEDKLFDVELSGYYSEGNEEDVELDVEKLEASFDKIYTAANKKLGGKLPIHLTEEDKKKIVEELDGGEIVDFTVEDVELDEWYNEDNYRKVERDIEISSIDLKSPEYKKGKIYFETSKARVSGSVK